MFNLKVDVDASIQEAFDRLEKEFPNDVAAAIYNEAGVLARAAAARAPHESGDLAASAYVTPPQVNAPVELGFGSLYAGYIHERTDLHHPGGGEAKFLQRTLDAETQNTLQRLAGELQPAFERGSSVSALAVLPTSAPMGVEKRNDTSRRARFNAAVRR